MLPVARMQSFPQHAGTDGSPYVRSIITVLLRQDFGI